MRRKWHYYKQQCGTNLSNDFLKYHFVRYEAGPKIDILIKKTKQDKYFNHIYVPLGKSFFLELQI